MRRYGIDDPTRIVVVQDELDLAPTIVRVKNGGGLAGHNGLRASSPTSARRTSCACASVSASRRRRRPAPGTCCRRCRSKQRELYDVAIQEAADAVEIIVTEGVDAAMRRYNVRDAGG